MIHLSRGFVCGLSVALATAGISTAAEKSLTWGGCIEEAIKSNPELAAYRENVKQSELSREITASGNRLQVSANAGAGRSGSDSSAAGDSYSYGASANRTLYDGGRTAHDLLALDQEIEASRLQYQVASSEARYGLRASFVGLIKVRSQLDILGGILERRQQNMRLVKLRYEGGREHKGSLLTAEAKFDQATSLVNQAQRRLELAARELENTIGWTSYVPIVVNERLELVSQPRNQPDLERLVDGSPAVRVTAARLRAAQERAKSAKADFMPSFDASASAKRSASEWPPEDDSWSVGVSVSLPIFEGGRRIAQVRKSQSDIRSAQADERGQRNSALLGLATAWTDLKNAVENSVIQEKFLAAASERAKIAEAQYSTGLITFDNWIIIEDALDQAQKDLVEAKAQSMIAEAKWIYAKGGTLENEVE